MPIQSGDVKLLKSAVMADVPEGGGAPTGTTIADGVSNAIFPDISELDRAGGRVNLRKSFVSVQTDDTDTYFGANVIVAEPPQDARVSVTLFSTEKTFDTREQAQVRIEAYLNKGPEWAGYLFENHIAGQRVIQLFQRVTDTIPNVGQTLVLIENESLGTQKEQYIRATSISVVERTFTYNGDQDYKANVVTVDISDALRYDFTGSPASRTFTRATNGTKVRDTVVADAGTYVGVVPLTQAAAVGDFTIKGTSIYTQLVPSAQTETPISFVPPYAAAGLPVPGAVAVSYTASHAWTTSIKFNLPGGCLPGSLTIQTDGITIFDDAGLLKTTSGTVGTIDYANGILSLNSGTMSNAKAVTGAAPLRPGSLSIQYARAVGGTQNVTAGIDGKIEATGISGSVDYETGLVRVRFGTMVTAAGNESQPWYAADRVGTDGKIFRPEPVAASSVRYSAVAYSYLPLDADLLGIDPVRLPSDGRVPIFRPGGFAVVGHTGKITTSVGNGQTINCARVRLSRVRVVGHDAAVIHTGYTTDLEAGTVTFTNVTGYSQPVTIEHRIEDMAVVRDVQISGEISFTRALTHEYPLASPSDPASGSFVSSALVAGDLFARVNLVFDQATWNGSWSDALSGSSATATFNNTQYPIRVTNRGGLTERWIVRLTNSTSFEVIGENVGVIANGNTSADCAPNNPATGVPYFVLPALGWGNGWATGNVLRFNTIGAQFPVWVVRTVQQGPESVPDDNFTLLIRGDVDTP